jgi:hypothetical protein
VKVVHTLDEKGEVAIRCCISNNESSLLLCSEYGERQIQTLCAIASWQSGFAIELSLSDSNEILK